MKTPRTRPTGPTINMETACYLIVKAREYDAKVPPATPDPASNPADDADVEILEDHADDPTLQELVDAIEGLNEDDQIELVALVWIGRGDFDRHEWRDALALARDRHTPRTAEYLVGLPNFGDCLEEGLARFGRSCEEFEIGRL